MKKNILFWLSCWSVLAFLFLPFSFRFLPDIGVGLSQLLLPLNVIICSWFGVDIQESFLISDSLAFYSTSLILALFSGGLTIISSQKGKQYLSVFQNWLFFALLLFLSYFLIRYGMDKLFGVQFYSPASNTLHTPTGQLGKDILFWTSMGTSTFYNAFMAMAEISAGVLILFNRTRLLGLLVGAGILLNIFAINIGFDITVKYVSGLLLISCLICLCFYASRLTFLIGMKGKGGTIPYLSDHWIFVFFIPFLIDLSVSYWHVEIKDSGRSYIVESVSGTSQLIHTTETVRIHLHPEKYIITENKQQQFTSLKKGTVQISIKGKQLIWREKEHEVIWKVKEIDLEKMELKQDKTHWYMEEFLSR